MNKKRIEELINISKKINYSSRGIYLWNYNLNYKPILYNFNEENIVNVIRKIKDETKFKTLEDTINNLNNDNNNSKCDKIIIENNNNELEDDEKILWISKTVDPDVYNLYLKETLLNEKSIGIANVSSLETSKMLRLAFKNKNASTLIKFKCKFNQHFNKWKPLYIIN